jgi:hypothetical protein
MDTHNCECGATFTSRERYEPVHADVVEQEMCDTIEGQFTSWTQIICPVCHEVVTEHGR